MARVAPIADDLDHHPNWSNVWNRVVIDITSHDSGGPTERCFALAAGYGGRTHTVEPMPDLLLGGATALDWAAGDPLVFGGDLNSIQPAIPGLRHVATSAAGRA